MEHSRFLEILSDDDICGKALDRDDNGCSAINGLKIIQKYIPTRGIEVANHDVIYSVDIQSLIDSGITEDDVTELSRQNWMVEDDTYLACFI